MHGWAEKGREHMPLLSRNAGRMSRTAPAALRGNRAVPKYRNGLFKENIHIFKSQAGKN